eukprot:scaffold51572_cov67-Phaeocystis_antarctica.AAC.6
MTRHVKHLTAPVTTRAASSAAPGNRFQENLRTCALARTPGATRRGSWRSRSGRDFFFKSEDSLTSCQKDRLGLDYTALCYG